MSAANVPANQRVVLITGAGAGLGEAMAHRFVKSGATVIATDRLEERVRGVAAALGTQLVPMAMEVTSSSDWQRVMEEIQRQFGRLDVVINNAGVAAAGKLEDTPIDDWRWVLDIDLIGVVLGCQAALPMLRRQGRGHIINVASVAGLAAAPQINAYGTAKAAVVAMSEMLRAEVHPNGIEVSALCPAFVETRLTETMRATEPHFEAQVKRWMARSGVSAADVAEVVYQAVEKPKFLLLTHAETKWLWRLKRWAPELYFKWVVSSAKKAEQKHLRSVSPTDH